MENKSIFNFATVIIYLGVEKRGTREGSCRTFRTESEEIVAQNGQYDKNGKKWPKTAKKDPESCKP